MSTPRKEHEPIIEEIQNPSKRMDDLEWEIDELKVFIRKQSDLFLQLKDYMQDVNIRVEV